MIDATNRNTALASALVDELARAGCVRAVLSPGSRSTPLALAIARHPGIEASVVVDERVAGFVALGAALSSGSPTLVACTSGSAAANLHPAVVEADQASVPIIVLTADRPPELRGIGAGQAIDQVKLYGTAVRWFCEVGTHDADDGGLLHYRAVGSRAVAESLGGLGGPVHLNLAWRDPLGPEPDPDAVSATNPLALGGRPGGAPITTSSTSRRAAPDLIERLAGRLAAAHRPLIVAGRRRGAGGTAIAAIAAKLGAPILAEPTSGLRFGAGGDATVVAAYDLIVRELPDRLRPDLVLRFGDTPTSKPLRALLADPAIEQIVVDPPGRWDEPTRIAAELIRAEHGPLAKALDGRLSEAAGEAAESARGWGEAEGAAQAAIDAALAGRWSEPLIHRELWRHLPEGSPVLIASSMPIRDAEVFAPAGGRTLDVVANRGANGIDGLISTATGLALATAGPSFAVLGDLATVHDLGGLANLASTGVDLRLLVINNGGGRIFEFLPQHDQLPQEEFDRLFTTPSSIEVAAAAAMAGIPHRRIDSIDGLAALAEPGPSVVEAVVEPSGNVALHREIAAAVGAALTGRPE